MPPKQPPYSDMVECVAFRSPSCPPGSSPSPSLLTLLSCSSSSRRSYAMHSAQGDKLSRTKIYDYLEALLPEFWQVDRTKKSAKERVSKALDDKVEEGILAKDKQSFVMTKRGERYYADRYKATDEESSAEEEAKATSEQTTKTKKQ
ncbi:hypothetical protein JCM8097_002367 [Rhodosporidiobolus ruineniae]